MAEQDTTTKKRAGAKKGFNIGHPYWPRSHGKATSVEYKTWNGMIQRCHNPNDSGYVAYGGRGITVCPEWRASFAAFFAHVGMRPSPKHSIDRYPNQDGNYEPGNVRWATTKEQARNVKSNVWIEFDGKRMVAKDWAVALGITHAALRRRMAHYPLAVALRPGRFWKRDRPILSNEQVDAIRAMYRPGSVTMQEVANHFGICRGHVCGIVNGKERRKR
jgi:hypothetical protein